MIGVMALIVGCGLLFLFWFLKDGGGAAEALDPERRPGNAVEVGHSLDLDTREDPGRTVAGVDQPTGGGESGAAGTSSQALVSGTVVDGLGRPVSGAAVQLGPWSRTREHGQIEATHGSTDSAGRFQVELAVTGERCPLRVTAEGCFPFVRGVGPFFGSSDLGELAVTRASVLEGQVVDENDRPVAGATLFELDPLDENLTKIRPDVSREELGASDGSGRFSVRGPATGGVVAIAARHPLHAMAAVQVEVADGASRTTGIKIRMQRGALVRGVVVGLGPGELGRIDEFSIAVAPRSALALLDDDEDDSFDGFTRRHPVASDGSFEIGGLAPGERVVLALWTGPRDGEATRRRSGLVIAEATSEPGAEPVEVRYLPPALGEIRILGPDGSPLERLTFFADELVFRGKDGIARAEEAQIEVEGGLVTLEGPSLKPESETTFDVWASVDGVGELDLFELIVRPGTKTDLGTHRLQLAETEGEHRATGRRREVTVRLVDRRGEPVPGGRIEQRRADANSITGRSVPVDGEGIARLILWEDAAHVVRFNMTPHVPPRDRYSLRSDPFAELAPWETIPSGTDDVEVTVVKPDLATGTLRITLDDRPLPSAKLSLKRVETLRFLDAGRLDRAATPGGMTSDGRGVVQLGERLPGAWRAWVYHASLRMPEVIDVELLPGHNEIHLRRLTTTISGRVVDDAGDPIAGATVRAEFAGIHPVRTQHEADPERKRPLLGGSVATAALRDLRAVTTDAQGRYELRGVTTGREIVAVALAPGHVVGESRVVLLAPGDQQQVPDIRLERGGAVRVILPIGHDGDFWLDPAEDDAADEGEEAHPGFWASVRDERVLDGIPPGDWSLLVEWNRAVDRLEDDLERRLPVTIEAGEVFVLDLR